MEDLIIFGILMVSAYFIGSHVEKKHYKSIEEREKLLPKVPVISFDKKNFPHNVERVEFISANTVQAADYFKTVLAGLVSFFGGNISVMESVLEHARRESVIRLKEKARNADFIANLRYETAEISEQGKRSAPKIEIYTYATAIYLKKDGIQTSAA